LWLVHLKKSQQQNKKIEYKEVNILKTGVCRHDVCVIVSSARANV